ncbi:SGNH/GDSL hydrolase family protein [Candidatus Saccharibacteria bacterium]|nr:SGNH/GDSL hydrolase family protein [Candidatus Saccharibacteria bacterium]
MKAKALLSFVFATVLGFTVYSTIVHGMDTSLWIGTPTPAKTMMQQNVTSDKGNKYCDAHTEQRIRYSPSSGSGWTFSGLEDVSGCWRQTDYGLFGTGSQGSYMRLTKNGPVIMVDNPFYHLFVPVGDSKRLIGVYTVGTQWNMYMYEDVAQAFSKQAGYYDKYTPKSDATKWRLNDPASGQALAMMRVAASQNGQWLIVEASNGFLRINTTTKEIITFENVLYRYGQGQDPTYDLAISNDGRYAVIGGGNVVDRTYLLYDLSTCISDVTKPLLLSPNCGKRNIKTELFPQPATNQAAQRFIFSDDNENITADVNESNQWNRYLITAFGKDAHGMEYLALGDSYSSGEGEYDESYYVIGTNGNGKGVIGFDTGIDNFPYASEKCHVSTRSYSYQLADLAGIGSTVFHNMACSGGKTKDILGVKDGRYNGNNDIFFDLQKSDLEFMQSRAQNNFVPGRTAQIEFIKTYKPRVATIGIGGNDIGFGDKLKDCLGAGTCSYVNDLRQYTGLEIKALYKKLVDTYQKLHNASPTTRFYVIGYPDVISDDSVCAPNVRLNADERYFAKQVVSYLDTVIQSAADTVGFTYLDIKDSLAGDRLCDLSFGGKAVQGLVAGDDQGPTIEIFGHEINPNIIGNESFHPTHIGHQMIANTIESRLGNDTILNHNPCAPLQTVLCPTEAPSIDIPPYFLPYTLMAKDVRQIQLDADNRYGTSAIGLYQQGGTLTANNPTDNQNNSVNDLLPGSTVTVSAFSTEQSLAPLQVDVNGKITGTITLPPTLEPGQHTLVLRTKNNLYQDVMLYQPIMVYKSLDDLDGDGIPNTQDQCQFVSPSGIDTDRDDIDDACDGIIDETRDTTPPVVTAHVDVQPNDKGWYARDVTIRWTANDDTDTIIASPADTIADQEGEHMYTSPQVCDGAGNCATGSITIKLDKTAPVVTAEMSRPANDNGWYADDVTISWGATDNVALQLTPPAPSIVTTEGEHTYASAQVCDDADNCATGSQSVKLDKTLPMMGELSWDKNPKKLTEVSHLTVPVTDVGSGIARVEYFIGDTDPGLGNGAVMHYDGTSAHVDQTTDFATGVYKISVRAQDAAGNWSQMSSGYLVVYDPTPGVKVRGRRTIKIVPGYAVNLPWVTSPTNATFGFSVKYAADGTIAKQSDLQFSYKTGSNCHRPARAINCHVFELNASSIKWLTVGGRNNSVATFEAAATLKQDNVTQTVTVVARAIDGTRVSDTARDEFMISIYQPTSLIFGIADLWAGPLQVQRGNVGISF